MSKFFTKSLHKKALECPTKLYYHSRPDEYDNNSLDDPFLKALAKGGFQVGELAKIYIPGGIEVTALRSADAIPETMELMKRDSVIIYEPAIPFGEFLVRVDILVKSGDQVRIYEVKAKSFDPEDDSFYNKTQLKKKNYQIVEKWQPYLYDIAFQTLVCRGAFPDLFIHPNLMLIDKSKVTTVDGLNQRFVLLKSQDRSRVKVLPGTDLKSVGEKILITLDVADDVQRILDGADQGAKSRQQLGMPSFTDEAKGWAKAYLEGGKLEPTLSTECKTCEFKTGGEKKSGFAECWKEKLKKDPPDGGLVIDLWNFRKSSQLIEEGRLTLRDVTREDLKIDDNPGFGMTAGLRQWVQVEKSTAGDQTPAVELGYLREVMKSWKFPLHCIDFETTRVAIPFHANRRPYEQIAFQFSHHMIMEDGSITHAGEYLHTKRGEFPNFEFVRALKMHLDGDQGTILRYAAHENSVLCDIHGQLQSSQESDKSELMAFIESITKSTKEDRPWEGPRNMVDLLEIVKKSYYHPMTKGSNSIKYVLPAVLHQSQFLQKKYSAPIYGSKGGIQSKNFSDYVWLKRGDDGSVIDPYKQLPPVFEGVNQEHLDAFMSDSDELAKGGAAMMAFSMMQFTEMSDLESKKLAQALLRYCELDTLAMVMIIEHFFELTGQATLSDAI